jgi:hypothetical protein
MGRNVQSVMTAGAVVIEPDACEHVCRVCNEVVSSQFLSLSRYSVHLQRIIRKNSRVRTI